MRSASAFASVRRKFAKLDKDFSLNIMGMFSLLILQGDGSLMGESSYVIMFYVNNEIKERDCPAAPQKVDTERWKTDGK